jgi:acetyl-CoA carboxylase biotin carboxyl carrier protein
MDLQELKKLIAVFEKSGVHELEIEEDGHRVLLKKESTQVVYTQAAQASSAAPSVATVTENTVKVDDTSAYVTSPLVGTFYTAANPQAKAYVEVGQTVNKGDIVCLVEAMKVMNEIKAPTSGVVKAILVDNGAMVEFNQRLIELGDA